MYFTAKAIRWAIDELGQNCHPFIGITFLACKAADLPVGSEIVISVDATTRSHLNKYHKLDPQSEFFFQPFKSVKPWVAVKYPQSGLQAINTQTFGNAFIHEKGSKTWGFAADYVQQISDAITASRGHSKASLLALAIWIGKDKYWGSEHSISEVIDWFVEKFSIVSSEIESLFFSEQANSKDEFKSWFQSEQADTKPIAYSIEPPPDAPSETEGTLKALKLSDIGPAKNFELEFGERLTLIAGDNGLGKSFLLDAAWWAITGEWAESPAFPFVKARTKKPKISFEIRTTNQNTLIGNSEFDWSNHSWVSSENRPSVSALCIYSRVDGSFAINDQMRAKLSVGPQAGLNSFSNSDVWDGKAGQIEGLIRDWVNWQLGTETDAFAMLVRVLEHLSPEDLGVLEPGEPRRIPGDPRKIPTIKHPYGEVPILFSSAGVKRILALAYLVIWGWQEHLVASQQLGEEPLKKMVIIVDELEAHLHPKWQRIVLLAWMTIGKLLSEDLEVQIIAATHSPMVLASIESEFSEDSDALFHLELEDALVKLEPLEFLKYGDISAWLTSPVFGLRHARSRDAERAIEAAKALQLSSNPDLASIMEVSNRLKQLLSPDDTFWSRWMFFAESKGANL